MTVGRYATSPPDRPRIARSGALLATALAAIVLGLGAIDGDESPALTRLRSMTREQREVLNRTLARFDELPGDEKAAIRELDSRLGRLDPEVRGRYMALLRRYHAFRESLPEDRRKTLDREKDADAKMALVLKYQEERRPAPDLAQKYADALQVSQLAPRRLGQTGRELILWFSLTEPEDAKDKAEFAKQKDPEARRKFLQNYPKRAKKKLIQDLRHEIDEFLAEGQEQLNKEYFKAEASVRAEFAKKAEKAKKPAEPKELQKSIEVAKAKTKNEWLDKNIRRLEPEIIRHHDSQPVSPENMERFLAELPPWAWDSLDPLPPEAARRRLLALYRLVFPIGREIPAPKEAAKKAPPGRTTPTPPPPGTSTPF